MDAGCQACPSLRRHHAAGTGLAARRVDRPRAAGRQIEKQGGSASLEIPEGVRREARTHSAGLTEQQARSWAYQCYIKDYLRVVASIDDNLGRLLDYLDQAGLTQNTVVFFTSDQGFFLGEHDFYDKRLMYEEAFSTPLFGPLSENDRPWKRDQAADVEPGFSRDDPRLRQRAHSFRPAGREFPATPRREKIRRGATPSITALRSRLWDQPARRHRTEQYKLIHFYAPPESWELYQETDDRARNEKSLQHRRPGADPQLARPHEQAQDAIPGAGGPIPI